MSIECDLNARIVCSSFFKCGTLRNVQAGRNQGGRRGGGRGSRGRGRGRGSRNSDPEKASAVARPLLERLRRMDISQGNDVSAAEVTPLAISVA